MMKSTSFASVLFVGATVCLSGVSTGQTALADGNLLQMAPAGQEVVPLKIGRLAPDGTVTEWVEYGGRREGREWVLVFDCFEPNLGQCPPELPCVGFYSCGQGEPESCSCLPPGCRWFRGPSYCNRYVTNDMEFHPAYGGMYARLLVLAWYWYVNGPGSGENMAVAVEFFEDFDDTCQSGDHGEWLGGVILDYGYWPGGGDFFWGQIDLTDLDWLPLPADGAGSYVISYLTYDLPGEYEPATCAQPMLWGTGDGEHPIPDYILRGIMSHQGPIQWDEDECLDYGELFDVCPDPLGAMLCFFVYNGVCVGDIDGDGDTDQGDLGLLLSAWDSRPGDPNWNPNADLDEDGHVGQGDLGILLGDWKCGVQP